MTNCRAQWWTGASQAVHRLCTHELCESGRPEVELTMHPGPSKGKVLPFRPIGTQGLPRTHERPHKKTHTATDTDSHRLTHTHRDSHSHT